MNLLQRSPKSCRLFATQPWLWLAALAVTVCLCVNPAHAQRHPPTMPNPNGSVTVRSTVGGPNAISITLGGPQPRPHQPWSPAPMTFGPAIGPPTSTTQPMTFGPAIPPPPQQPARVYYVYFRNTPGLPWTCLGGYRQEAQAQLSVNWFRQHGGEAFYR